MTNTALKLNEIEYITNDEIALDISDIITICKKYSVLGYQIQNQIGHIVELGIDEAINSGNVNVKALPYIRDFLKSIMENGYFGEACNQSAGVVLLIDDYELKHPEQFRNNNRN